MGTQSKADEEWRPFSLAHSGGEEPVSLFVVYSGVAVVSGKGFVNETDVIDCQWNDEL
jgi:hypothetical protein